MKLSYFTDGIFKNNAVFAQALGLCPTLAVTTSAANGMGMGIATAAVLVCSNFAVSLAAPAIPKSIRIPAYIVIIASFVTAADLLTDAYFHELHKVLGLFIPLIVVNCVVLGRAEAFASKNGALSSVLDGLGAGLGFALALTLLGACRELLGTGRVFGFEIAPGSYVPAVLAVLPPGAFIVLGFLIAAFKGVSAALENRNKKK